MSNQDADCSYNKVPIQSKMHNIHSVIIVILTYIPYALSGISRSFSAFLLPQLRSSDSSFHISSEEETWIGSLTILTMPFGCLTAGVMMHYLGRKLCLLGILLPYIAAWAITVFAEDVNMLYLQTVLNGMGSGMTFCTATYLAEICCVKHRGPLISLVEPMFYLGVVFCNTVLYFFGWQHSAKIFCAMSTISFFSIFFLPESPNWLVMKGYTEKASRVLTRVGRSETQVTLEITEMEMQYKLSKEQYDVGVQVGICRVIGNLVDKLSTCWKALLIMSAMFLIQQMTGYNALVGYTVIFFDELRLPVDSSICAIAYSACSFSLSFISPAIIAYVGRKWCMAISGFGMGLFASVVFIYEMIYYHVPAEDKPYYLIPLLSMYGCNVSACLGLVMLPFIMASEVIPAHMAGIGCGICGCLGYIIAGSVLKIFPHYLSYFGIQVVLATLALSAFCAIPFAYFILPETRGKTNSEIQREYFSSEKSAKRKLPTDVA